MNKTVHYIFYKLCVGKHEEVIKDRVQAAVCGLGVADEAVQLLFNLMGLGQHSLGEVLEKQEELRSGRCIKSTFHMLKVIKVIKFKYLNRSWCLTPESAARDQLALFCLISSTVQDLSQI